MASNIHIERKGDVLIIKVDVSKQVIEQAPFSSTGKSKMLASSGGWQRVDGNGIGYNLNVNYRA